MSAGAGKSAVCRADGSGRGGNIHDGGGGIGDGAEGGVEGAFVPGG